MRSSRSRASSALGLTIDAASVRLVELVDKGAKVRSIGELPLPGGAVAAGEIHQPEVVGKAIAELVASTGAHTKKADLVIAGPRVALRLLEVPDMPESDLQTSLLYQVGDVLPIAAADMVVDYQSVGFLEGTDGKRTRQILVVASHRDQIRGYLEAVKIAGLQIRSIDSAPLALARSLRDLLAPYDPTTGSAPVEGIVQVGPDTTNVVVTAGGTTMFGRTLSAGADVDGLDVAGDAAAIADRLFPLMEDVRNSLAFAISQVARERLSRVLLVADPALEQILVDCLQATLGVVVQPVWVTHLADVRQVRGAESVDGTYAVPFAAALNQVAPADEHVPSLLPTEIAHEARRRRELMLAGTAVAGVAGVLAFLTVGHGGLVLKANHDRDQATKKVATLQKQVASLAEVSDLITKASDATATVKAAVDGTIDTPRLLNDIADHLPPDTRVTSITLSTEKVTFNVEGTNPDSAPEILDAFATSKRLTNIWIASVSRSDPSPDDPQGAVRVSFSVQGSLTPEAGSGRSLDYEVTP